MERGMTEPAQIPSAGAPVDLSLAEAQRAVDASIQALGGYWPPLANLARLFEECGELARAINQLAGPKRVKAGEARADVAEEVGDALYTVLVIANSLEVDASAALRRALETSASRAGTSAPAPDQSGRP
jgi:NTP pyrophosphatase (non-canonical NTP hydrolase)